MIYKGNIMPAWRKFVYHTSQVEKRNLPLAVRLLRNCTETFSPQFLGLGSDLYNYRQCFLCIYCQPLLFPPKVDCNSSLSCSAKILKSIWNIFFILVPCRLTKESSDSNKRRQTLDAVLRKWRVQPVLLTQQLHCFRPRHSQFWQNKSTRALQLDLVCDNFHT